MEKILQMAKDLGHALQQEESFAKMQAAQNAADADGDLQALIGEFNLKRMAINEQAANPDADAEKKATLNEEIREVYAKIMENPSMKAYNEAKTDFDQIARAVTTIINMSMQGIDPDTYDENGGCGGNCASCGGCH